MDNEALCRRCGEEGEDRRTLYMACFYQMGELGLPFDKQILFHAKLEDLEKSSEPAGITLRDGTRLNLTSGTVKTSGELTPHDFYTLRVCKECRGSWMLAIKEWFNNSAGKRASYDDQGNVRDIPVRENGTTVMLSRREYDKRQFDKETTDGQGFGRSY